MAQTAINGATQIREGSVTGDRLADGTINEQQLAQAYILANGGRSMAANLDLDGFLINNLGTPSTGTDAATKAYVDGLLQGFDWKQSVRAASAGNGTLSSAFKNGSVIDGVTLVTGDRILIKDQTTASENGLYTVNANGAPTRSEDADADSDFSAGLTVFVSEGTLYGNSSWSISTNDPISLGTTAVVFTQVAGGALYTAGNGITQTGSEFSVDAADSSITVDVNGVAVNLSGDGSIEVDSGLQVVHGTPGQVYIANVDGILTPVTLNGDVSSINDEGYVNIGGDFMRSSRFVVRETPNGTVNGTNTAFTIINVPYTGSEQVFLNGLLQEPGAGNDYAISNSTITFADAPVTGDRIRVTYTSVS